MRRETYTTDYCSNRYKMSMFSVWILVYLVAIGWIISLIYDEIRKRGWSLNLRMTVFICSLVGYIGELLSQFLFLFSVQSSGKYIIFAIAPTTVAITYYFATRAWFSTVINSNMEIDKNNIRWIFYCMATTGVFIPTIYITVCYVAGPIVSIETGHPEYLNIFYLTRLSCYIFTQIYSDIIHCCIYFHSNLNSFRKRTTTSEVSNFKVWISRYIDIFCRFNERMIY